MEALLDPNSEFWHGAAFGVMTCVVLSKIGSWWRNRKESEGEK